MSLVDTFFALEGHQYVHGFNCRNCRHRHKQRVASRVFTVAISEIMLPCQPETEMIIALWRQELSTSAETPTPINDFIFMFSRI